MTIKQAVTRFAVGTPDGAQSSVWRLWTNNYSSRHND